MQKLILCLAVSLSLSTVFLPYNSYARVHDFETTRLKSTAGAGVASLLGDESSFLNPAPVSFLNYSSMYIQRSQAKLQENNNSSARLPDNFSHDSISYALAMTDSKNDIKGSFSYVQQHEAPDKRKRMSIAMSSGIGKQSSFGVTYRYTTDKRVNSGKKDDKYHQAIFGITHVLSESFILGAIIIDPFKGSQFDRKIIVGGQYAVSDIVAVIFDLGTDYQGDLSDKLLYKAALQFKFFEDFYLRAGLFNDKGLQEKGNGIGIGWIGPVLSLDFALKTTTPTGRPTTPISYGHKVQETAFSLGYHF